MQRLQSWSCNLRFYLKKVKLELDARYKWVGMNDWYTGFYGGRIQDGGIYSGCVFGGWVEVMVDGYAMCP